MRIRNIEFGISRDSNNKVAPFEFGYTRAFCDCSVWSIGWFYFTILRGDCRDTVLPKQAIQELVESINERNYPGYSWGYEESLPLEPLEDEFKKGDGDNRG